MMILEANKIRKSYGNKLNKQEVLKGIDIHIEKGEFVSIMGASGSGKTTLLNVLSSIDQVSHGTININGNEMTSMKEKRLAEFRKQHLGFIFQDYNLLDTLTVKENILLPLSITKISKRKPIASLRKLQRNWEFMNYVISTRMKFPAARSREHRPGERLFMTRALFSLMNRPARWIRNQPPIY